jgi:hypothetical protein
MVTSRSQLYSSPINDGYAFLMATSELPEKTERRAQDMHGGRLQNKKHKAIKGDIARYDSQGSLITFPSPPSSTPKARDRDEQTPQLTFYPPSPARSRNRLQVLLHTNSRNGWQVLLHHISLYVRPRSPLLQGSRQFLHRLGQSRTAAGGHDRGTMSFLP